MNISGWNLVAKEKIFSLPIQVLECGMKTSLTRLAVVAAAAAVLAGCANDGTNYRSDTYTTAQVNQAQEVKTVEIISIIPAKVVVDNSDYSDTARNVGALLGAVGGALIGSSHSRDTSGRVTDAVIGGVAGGVAGQAAGGMHSTTQVDGVQITFRDGQKLFNSSQVGKPCEYRLGTAIMVSPSPNETRIQPNNVGGCEKK